MQTEPNLLEVQSIRHLPEGGEPGEERLGDREAISPAVAKNSHLTEYASKELLGRERQENAWRGGQ